jgi:hypothetical protein
LSQACAVKPLVEPTLRDVVTLTYKRKAAHCELDVQWQIVPAR